MKKLMTLSVICMVMFWSPQPLKASLQIIGTATYDGIDYFLIYDDNNNGQGLVWLDYRHPASLWQNQLDWVTGLNDTGVITSNLNPGVTINWAGEWRLPSASDSPVPGTGESESEMGHLYSIELGNSGSLQETGDFTSLLAQWYWLETVDIDNTNNAWAYYMHNGWLARRSKTNSCYAMAVRSVTSAVFLPPYIITSSVLSGGGSSGNSTSFKLYSTIGQPTPLMGQDNIPVPPQSTGYENYPGFGYTLDGQSSCASIDIFANAYGTFFGDPSFNVHCDLDKDLDVDGADLSILAATL